MLKEKAGETQERHLSAQGCTLRGLGGQRALLGLWLWSHPALSPPEQHPGERALPNHLD